MKVLMIVTQFPYPKDNGKKIILSNIIEYFIDKYGLKNIELIVVGDNPLNVSNVKITAKFYKKPSSYIQLKNVIFYSLLLRRKSIQESVLYNEFNRRDIIKTIEQGNYDIVIYDTVRISQLFENNKFKNTKEFVYLDDLFSIRYEKMLKTMNEFPKIKFNVLGNFAKFLPKYITKLVSFKIINKYLLKYEQNIIKKREVETANIFPNALLISQEETNILNSLTKKATVKSIRPVVESNKSEYYRDYKGEPNFIFLGALNVPHNSVSVHNFLKVNIKKIVERIPNAKIKIIGTNPNFELREFANRFPDQVELMGYVENLDQLFNRSCAMIIPLLFGSGVKLKTLESFSRGLPIITTEYGIEGIDLPLNGECIVENNIENYVLHMEKLLDPTYNEEVSNLAYSYFCNNYTKEKVYQQYDRLFK
ncbi:glycosyltransferase family 4 protein [Bacillaceae bacterium OS4b]|nr:glycosyltransferase family 4 protein [Bacillaceae bacterium OS4b]